MSQHHGAHRAQRLLWRHLQRSLVLDCVPHICIKSAIISALGFHFCTRPADWAKCAPPLFIFHAPIGSPILAFGKVPGAEAFFLWIHSVFHDRSLRAVYQTSRRLRVGAKGLSTTTSRSANKQAFAYS